jgi:hypothetical protein
VQRRFVLAAPWFILPSFEKIHDADNQQGHLALSEPIDPNKLLMTQSSSHAMKKSHTHAKAKAASIALRNGRFALDNRVDAPNAAFTSYSATLLLSSNYAAGT